MLGEHLYIWQQPTAALMQPSYCLIKVLKLMPKLLAAPRLCIWPRSQVVWTRSIYCSPKEPK